MKPVTLLHLNTESGWRGGEAQTLRLVEGLGRRGHNCLLVTQPGSALRRRAESAGLRTMAIPMRGELDLAAARRLADIVRSERVELLHYHTAHAVTLGTLATLLCGRRPAIAARRVSFPLRSRIFGRLKYTWRVDRVVAVSEAIRRRLIGQGLRSERVVTVHSGIDPERFATGDRARFRASLTAPGSPGSGIRDSTFLIGTVGHLTAHKGIDLFLEAAALAAPEIPEALFLIAGRGEEEASLRLLAARLGILERVLFAGFRDDTPDLFAGLDLFVLASHSGEGSPAVLKESMAAGVALAATALEGVEEIVEDGCHGLLTPPRNAPALARAMVLLASDPALRTRLADAARERVREFTAERMVEKTEAIYRSIGPASWRD
ncbi:MAG TPA: glycosyltransferase [Candidatus Polarisedimenticolia bacterium]|nr:glycosyltransferase [Candidatus Polarisedimenticolia bacterium]